MHEERTSKSVQWVWPKGSRSREPAGALDQLDIDDTGIPGHRHRAGYDAQLTHRLLAQLLASADIEWDDLVSIAALPAAADTQRLW